MGARKALFRSAAIVASLFSVLTSERRIAAENVTEERNVWRGKIREVSVKVSRTLTHQDVNNGGDTLDDLRAEFSLLVNPHEIMDQQILALIAQNGVGGAEEFVQRVTLLLKHDWERAKREASLWRRLWERKPARVRF
jgi:hypothetical protein